MNFQINEDWALKLKHEFNREYYIKLMSYLEEEYKNNVVFPPKDQVFNCFNLTPFDNVKVVIIGQDPYHGDNEANGLSFSTNNSKLPPSLKNIFKELKEDLGVEKKDGNLDVWAKQGVLLLNTCLTVRKNTPLSHSGLGWEIFTDSVIKLLSNEKEKIIFVLWGNNAIKKEILIDSKKHIIIRSSHPSPFSARKSFFGSKCFSFINKNLDKPIEW